MPTSLVGGESGQVCFLLGMLHAYTYVHKHTLVIPNIKKCQTRYRHRLQWRTGNFTWRNLLISPLFSGCGDDDHDSPVMPTQLIHDGHVIEVRMNGRPLICTKECVICSLPNFPSFRGHSVLSWLSSTPSSPGMASGTLPSPWNSSSISCCPALPARDAHRAAPSRRPSERSIRAYSKNTDLISLCANAGQGELITFYGTKKPTVSQWKLSSLIYNTHILSHDLKLPH